MKDFMVKVSIIVPMFNSENVIIRCLDSIARQSFRNFLCIIVDDGSKDSSYLLACQFALLDNRFKVLTKNNGGVSSARNFGIANAYSNFVTFVDSDDAIHVDYLSSLLSETNDPGGLVIAGHEKIYSNGKVIKCIPLSGYFTVRSFISNLSKYISTESVQGPCSKLFDLELIKKNNVLFAPGLSYGEDTLFVYSYLLHCDYVKAVNTSVYSYYVGDTGLSSVDVSYRISSFVRIYSYLFDSFSSSDFALDGMLIKKSLYGSLDICFDELFVDNICLKYFERRNVILGILGDVSVDDINSGLLRGYYKNRFFGLYFIMYFVLNLRFYVRRSRRFVLDLIS